MMNVHISTYIHVLAGTYPELAQCLQQVFRVPLSEQVLERHYSSPIFRLLIKDLAIVTQNYASSYNQINLVLGRIGKMIDDMDVINYEHLSEDEQIRLPELAKEVDAMTVRIREEIYPNASKGREGLVQNLTEQLQKTIAYLRQLNVVADDAVVAISKDCGVNLNWTEGKQVITNADLAHWVDRNPQIDEKFRLEVAKEHETAQDYLRAVLKMEALVALFPNKAMGDESSGNKKDVKKVFKFIDKLDMSSLDFWEVEQRKGEYVEQMQQVADTVENLEKELAVYPFKDAQIDDESIKDLKRLSETDQIFSTVGDVEKDITGI